MRSLDVFRVGRAFRMDGVSESASQNLPLEWDAVSQRSHKRKLHPIPDVNSGTRFPDAKKATRRGLQLIYVADTPHDKPRSNNRASVRAEAYKVHREFRTQRRPLNVASVLRRTVRAGDVAPYARPGPPGSRQLDDRCKTFHQLFGLAGFFELDLDHVSGDRDHGTGAKGLVAHGIARGKVL